MLLHGLARSEVSLLVMAEALEAQGHLVVNHGDASTEAPIAVLATEVAVAVALCPAEERLHFVTHSLGGILLRVWLQDQRPADIGRAVMLGPPNQGSELVDQLGDIGAFEGINGPADFDLGAVADTLSLNQACSALIPGPDDGKVSVAATRIKGMAARRVLPVTHTFMMMHPQVVAQTIVFLRGGTFAADLSLGAALKIAAGGGG